MGEGQNTNPAVYCAHDAMVDLKLLSPNPRNPNKHPKPQVELLAKIIQSQGWRAPVTVSTLSKMIVKGHCRLEAAKLAGLQEAPVDYQDYASEAEEMADLLADNKIAELAKIDKTALDMALDGLEESGFDLELAGFMTETEKCGDPAADYIPDYKVLISCRDENHQRDILEQIESLGIECQALTL